MVLTLHPTRSLNSPLQPAGLQLSAAEHHPAQRVGY